MMIGNAWSCKGIVDFIGNAKSYLSVSTYRSSTRNIYNLTVHPVVSLIAHALCKDFQSYVISWSRNLPAPGTKYLFLPFF